MPWGRGCPCYQDVLPCNEAPPPLMGTPCHYPTLHIPPMVPPGASHHTQQQLDLSPSNHPPTIMVHVCHSTSTCYSPSICYSPTPPSSPSQVQDTCIFEAILIHTMAGPYCHAATVTIFHSQITLTVHIYTTSTYISNRHWTGLEQLTLSCVLAWAPLSSNILIHSTFPSIDAYISAVSPYCWREWHISVP